MGYLNEDGLATLVGKVKGQVVQLTAAEYRQIPAETKNTDNKIYFVEDDDYAYAIDNEPTLNSENLVKSGGVYNYTSKIGTGALTTTAQTLIPAVNELKAAVDTNTSDIATLNNGLTSFEMRKVNFPYSIAANGNAHGNLYALINNNMPSGYRFLAFAGFNTASVNVFMTNMRYVNSDYSIELRNVSSATVTQTSDIFYLCAKI